MEKWEKLRRGNLENIVNVQKQPPEMHYKNAFLKLDEIGVRYSYIICLFVSFWCYYNCILSRGSRTEVFLKKLFLKIL